MSEANVGQLDHLVICDHVNSRSEYCEMCSHGQPHTDLIGCSKRKETCKARRVGKTVCVELASNIIQGTKAAGTGRH